MRKYLLLTIVLFLSVLPISNAIGDSWGLSRYHYFIPSNGGKIYCKIIDKAARTVRIGAHYEGCRYGDIGSSPWGSKRFQEIKGNEIIPSTVELRYCDELKKEDYSVGVYTVVGLDSRAFLNCTQLISITLPNTVRDIKNQAFAGCTALEKVVLSSKIDNISEYAFFGCTNLYSINLPEGTKTYETTFMDCDKLNLQ